MFSRASGAFRRASMDWERGDLMCLTRGVLLTLILGGWILADSAASKPKRPQAAPRTAITPQGTGSKSSGTPAVSDSGFKQHVEPILTRVCSQCHNERLASGGMNVLHFTDAK